MPKSGFVLLTVVVMLSVVAGLILTQNKMIQLAMRRQHLYASAQTSENQLEAVAQTLVLRSRAKSRVGRFLQRGEITTATVPDDSTLQKNVLTQGQDYAKHYRYLITDLGDYPCMKLSGSHASHHWLLSLLDMQIPTRMLQLRIAIPIPELPCIDHPVSYHPVGLLSWRSVVINPTNLKIS